MIPEVGKAYRCRDGIVRWVTGKSRRGYLHLLWLEEEYGVWHSGGSTKTDRWERFHTPCEPFPAPQSGEAYRVCGPLGGVSERVAP